MPNWCHNYAEITCPDREIYDKLLEAIIEHKWFQTFAPLNLDPEIHKNGYDYKSRVIAWGTKWEAGDIEVINENEIDLIVELYFDTAWSPPFGVYKSMKAFFGMEIISMFHEPGCCFFGNCEYSKYVHLKATYNYPCNEEELQELEKRIGNRLNDYMSPTWTELMEEWASEVNNEDNVDSDLDKDTKQPETNEVDSNTKENIFGFDKN